MSGLPAPETWAQPITIPSNETLARDTVACPKLCTRAGSNEDSAFHSSNAVLQRLHRADGPLSLHKQTNKLVS